MTKEKIQDILKRLDNNTVIEDYEIRELCEAVIRKEHVIEALEKVISDSVNGNIA